MDARLLNIEQKMEVWERRMTGIETSMASCTDALATNTRLISHNTLKIRNLEERAEALERRARENNLIIYGIESAETDSRELLLQKVKKLMAEDMQITDDVVIAECHRLGRGPKAPILIEVPDHESRISLLKNSSKLRILNIFMSRDYSPQIREQRKILIEKRRELYRKGIGSKVPQLTRMAAERKQNCELASMGCGATFSSKEEAVEHAETCGYIERECPMGCGARLLKKELIPHLSGHCTFRNVTCTYCGMEVVQNQLDAHQENCDLKSIPCDYCGLSISKKEMSSHLLECLRKPVPCSFREMGCDFEGEAASRLDHEMDVQLHFPLLGHSMRKLTRLCDNIRNSNCGQCHCSNPSYNYLFQNPDNVPLHRYHIIILITVFIVVVSVSGPRNTRSPELIQVLHIMYTLLQRASEYKKSRAYPGPPYHVHLIAAGLGIQEAQSLSSGQYTKPNFTAWPYLVCQEFGLAVKGLHTFPAAVLIGEKGECVGMGVEFLMLLLVSPVRAISAMAKVSMTCLCSTFDWARSLSITPLLVKAWRSGSLQPQLLNAGDGCRSSIVLHENVHLFLSHCTPILR
ncbi:hypothetical protein LAZ67_13001867 [Cordylochernes scorpioides]|uniref:TRAF-type domain-containing protein n=1 Tax=Cordylochernes scorpioides TaxID=51811 RepID=A0ABY6L462_9ARAC|nr:hypothetical protein LAZ67_13001867 [Cordylochernes scorpioides]